MIIREDVQYIRYLLNAQILINPSFINYQLWLRLMKKLILTTLTFALTITSAFAQKSPEILPDGRVTFRCKTGKAKIIKVQGQFEEPVALEQDEQGIWEGTSTKPIKPGIYEYSFNIDGIRTVDGRNTWLKPQRWPGSSILHIPDSPAAHWDLQKIPHGTVHHHDYFSKSLNKWRALVVYTPPKEQIKGPLPVFYLAHGYSDNQKTWTVHGKAHWILDSLINQGKAKPMIIVMPNAHAIDPPDIKKFDTYGPKNTKAFSDDLIEDVIPFIEDNYNVRKDTAGRAFAGLSMGGGHALSIALRHNETFSQVGAFSSATPKGDFIEEVEKNADNLNRNLKVFWIACGDKDFLYERNQTMIAEFKRIGIKHDYYVTPDDTHAWPVWRRYLVEFLPKLF